MAAATRFLRFMEEQSEPKGATSAPSSKPKCPQAGAPQSEVQMLRADFQVAFKWLVVGGLSACAFLLSVFIGSHVSLLKMFHDGMSRQTSEFNTRLSELSDRVDTRIATLTNDFHAALLAQSKDLRRDFSERSRHDEERLSAHSDRMNERLLEMNGAIARLEAKGEVQKAN